MSKPNDLKEYLADFIDDAHELVLNGISYQEMHFTVELNSFVCDAPARAMLKLSNPICIVNCLLVSLGRHVKYFL